MRNNKKKGFTLVELLVVIAILAILATVSVVTYTSYIESTTVRVDEDLAVQLNNFLGTVKVDINGEHYEDLSKNGVTADNVIEITNYIKSTGGLESITPKAAKYGYHFYFDLVDQKYVLIADDDDRIDSKSMFSRLIHAASTSTQTAYPELAIAKDNRYFLVETGTELANLVAGFRNIKTAEELDAYISNVEAYETEAGKQLTGLVNLVKETVFTTNNGHFIVSGTTDHKHLFVQNDLVVSNQNNHQKVSLSDDPVTITKDAPLVTLQKDQTIVLSLADGVTLAKHSFWFADGSKATLVIDGINTLEELITRVDVDFTNANIVVGGKTYTVSGATFKDAEGNIVTGANGEAIAIEEKNKVISFSYSVSGAVNKVNGDYIAIDGGTFTLTADNFKGLLNDEISTKEVTWKITNVYYYDENDDKQTVANYSNYVSKSADGQSITLTITIPENSITAPAIDGIEITASSVIGKEGTVGDSLPIDLKVVRITGVKGVTLDTHSLNLDGNDKLTLINAADVNTEFDLNNPTEISYNHPNSGVTPDFNMSIVNTNDVFTLTNNNKTLALKAGTDEISEYKAITVKVDNLFEKTVKVRILSSKNLNFTARTDNSQIQIIGDDNSILLSDLFNKNENMAIPEGAEIWFTSSFGDSDETPGEIAANAVAESRFGTTTAVSLTDWENTSIQFTNGAANKAASAQTVVSVAIVIPNEANNPAAGGRRISDARLVTVVDGYNVKSYADFVKNLNLTSYSESTYCPTKASVVLLNNIKIEKVDTNDDGTVDTLYDHFAIGSYNTSTGVATSHHLYGNCFDFDVKAGLYKAGIIYVHADSDKGTGIHDVRIIGDYYTRLGERMSSEYGSPAIRVQRGKVLIENSYLANCRSPLRLDGSTTTLKNTIVFGGRYANIDLAANCTLNIEGKVVLVNHEYKGIIGMGIVAWFNDVQEKINLGEGAELKQYNFMCEDDTDSAPKIYSSIDVSKPFVDMITNTTDYGKYQFMDGTTPYVNTGIMAIDRYTDSFYRDVKCSCGYTGEVHLSGIIPGTSKCTMRTFDASKNGVYVKFIASQNVENATITITYKTSYYAEDAALKISDGKLVETRTLKVGEAQVFKLYWKGSSWVDYKGSETDEMYDSFTITITETYTDENGETKTRTIDARDTLVVDSDFGYGSTEYVLDEGLSTAMSTASKAEYLHGKGIHSKNKITFGMHSLVNDLKDGKSGKNHTLFLEQLNMTNSEKEGYNWYVPEEYGFTNGSIIGNLYDLSKEPTPPVDSTNTETTTGN